VAAQESTIQAVVEEYSRSLEAGDVDRLLDLFADEPVFVHPMLPAMVGMDALRTFVRQIFGQQAASGNTIQIQRIALAEDGWAHVVAAFSTTWVPSNGAEPFAENDRYLFVLTRNAGDEWRLKWVAFYEVT
jgi:uncharacterized protein (TIGR02246 family)